MQLKSDDINDTASNAASTVLHLTAAPRVFSEPTIGWQGDETLRVTVVLSDDVVSKIDGETALDLVVKIGEDLRDKGEERFPIVEFATEEELAAGDDPEA